MRDDKTTINQLREAAWRRDLTPAEAERLRRWLEAHPADRAQWENEIALTAALRSLPKPAVSSNFTARVLQELDRGDNPREQVRWPWRLMVWRWLPRVAVAGIAVSTGLFFIQRHRQTELYQSVTLVSSVGSIPNPQILQDFDAIRALNQAPAADQELLALLK